MKQIVIIGGSPAGIHAAEELRGLDPQSIVKVFLTESHLPFVRANLLRFLANEISLDKVYLRDKGFYEQQGIELIFEKKISRVNFRRSQVTFEDKGKVDYDVLIVSDVPHTRLPEVKGNHRSGVFGLRRVSEAVEIAKLLPVVETVVIQGQTLSGLRLAVALRQRGKEVIWVTAEPMVLSGSLSAVASQALRGLVEAWGIRIMEQNEIAEVLGDTEVKAVRLKSGKVIATQIVIYPEASPDFKIFKDTDLQFDEKIPTNVNFQSNVSNAYAVDDVGRSPIGACAIWEDGYPLILEQQGKAVAATVAQQGLVAEYPLAQFHCAFQNDHLHLIGRVRPRATTRLATVNENEQKKFRQLLVENDMVVGAVLINNGGQVERLCQLIQEQKPFAQQTDSLVSHLMLDPPSGTAEVEGSADSLLNAFPLDKESTRTT